jgi:hypothetical protein
MTSEAELAYFAGFFDGEGCVGINPVSKAGGVSRYYCLYATARQIDTTPLQMLKEAFGGCIQGPHNASATKRGTYSWRVQAAQAEQFLVAVLPYLVVKRAQAELALEFRRTFHRGEILPKGSTHAGNPARRHAVMERREMCYREMRALNRRGPRP